MVAIERFRRKLKWDKFSLIGHSMGGAFAMLYAGMKGQFIQKLNNELIRNSLISRAGVFPERVEKLVMLDIARTSTTIPEMIDHRLRKTTEKLLKYEEAIIAGPEKPISYEEAVEKGIKGSFGSLNEEACHIMYKRGLKKVDGGYVFARDRR